MKVTVKLSAILDALDMTLDEWSAYLDKRTGKIHALPDDAFLHAEEDAEDDDEEDEEEEGEEEIDEDDDGSWSEYSDITKKDLERSRDILAHGEQYIELPSKFDIHEYRIMQRFSQEHEDVAISNQLCQAISGRGAFRYFKDTLRRLGIADDWYRYRNDAFKRIAIEWCEDNDIGYTDD